MKIHLVCNDGSPIGVTPERIFGQGVGGAELAMMSLMEAFADRGHEVAVYNEPKSPGVYNGVEYLSLSAFNVMEPCDGLIIFRSPNPRVGSRHGAKRLIWWSCDQYTVGDFAKLAAQVEVVVCISPFHRNYFETIYHIPRERMTVVDIGVRQQDYQFSEPKVKNRLIWCSIPDRGLAQFLPVWLRIKEAVSDASLTITSDYRLWGLTTPNNMHHRLSWAAKADVDFKGAVPRTELCRLQEQAEIMAYPSIYEELFCIAAAECQVAGAIPVTSVIGALPDTNAGGILVPGIPGSGDFDARYAEQVIRLLTTEREYMEHKRATMTRQARMRFNFDAIVAQWERLIEEGLK